MVQKNLPSLLLILMVSTFSVATAFADTIEIKNGTRIVGKVTKIDGGSVVVATDFAGTITIKQSEVVGISTDAPVAIRLESGTRFDGRVAAGSGGSIQIAGSDGTITTTMDKIAASWAAGGKDPSVAALERRWTYEAAIDMTGKTGTGNSWERRHHCGRP